MSATVPPQESARQAAEVVRRTLEEIREIEPDAALLTSDGPGANQSRDERSGDSSV